MYGAYEAGSLPLVRPSVIGRFRPNQAIKQPIQWSSKADALEPLGIEHGACTRSCALVRDLLLVEVDAAAVHQTIARSASSGLRRKPDISAV
jgi:hypothetical protein